MGSMAVKYNTQYIVGTSKEVHGRIYNIIIIVTGVFVHSSWSSRISDPLHKPPPFLSDFCLFGTLVQVNVRSRSDLISPSLRCPSSWSGVLYLPLYYQVINIPDSYLLGNS